MDRPTFKPSLETQQLVKLLSDATHDDTFTYDEMSQAAGVNIREHRGCLYSALRSVQRELSIVFDTIPNIGIKRSDDASIVGGRTRDIAHIRSTARRGLRKLECIRDVSSLPGDKRTQLNVLASGLGVIAHATTAKAQGQIEQIVLKAKNKLPVAEALAALGVEK